MNNNSLLFSLSQFRQLLTNRRSLMCLPYHEQVKWFNFIDKKLPCYHKQNIRLAKSFMFEKKKKIKTHQFELANLDGILGIFFQSSCVELTIIEMEVLDV